LRLGETKPETLPTKETLLNQSQELENLLAETRLKP
jgi:hypothetical protein